MACNEEEFKIYCKILMIFESKKVMLNLLQNKYIHLYICYELYCSFDFEDKRTNYNFTSMEIFYVHSVL